MPNQHVAQAAQCKVFEHYRKNLLPCVWEIRRAELVKDLMEIDASYDPDFTVPENVKRIIAEVNAHRDQRRAADRVAAKSQAFIEQRLKDIQIRLDAVAASTGQQA